MTMKITYMYIIGLIGAIIIISPVLGKSPVLACFIENIISERLEFFKSELCTHVFYKVKIAFNETVILETELRHIEKKRIANWKESNPFLQFFISTSSDIHKKHEFRNLLAEERNYKSFIRGLINYLNENNLSGFDIEYDYLLENRYQNASQSFLQNLSEELHKNNKFLTTTILLCYDITVKSKIVQIANYFRFIFVICEDYGIEFISTIASGRNRTIQTVGKAIDKLRNFNVNTSLLVLGIQLKAYVYKFDKQTNNSHHSELLYNDACMRWKGDNDIWTKSFDPPQNYSKRTLETLNQLTEIYYNSPKDMKSKIQYVKQKQIAGVVMRYIYMDDVFNLCDEEITVLGKPKKFPILRSTNKYTNMILTRSWEYGYTLPDIIQSTTGTNMNAYETDNNNLSSSGNQSLATETGMISSSATKSTFGLLAIVINFVFYII